MSVECEYCHVTVQRATYLPIHQSTTRKCILIQKTLGIDRATKLYECEYCHKQQTTKDNNIKHSATCKIKLQKEKESVQKKLNDSTTKVKTLTNTIEDRLEELASDFRNYKEESSKKEEQASLKQTSLEKEIIELKKQINAILKQTSLEKEIIELKKQINAMHNNKNKTEYTNKEINIDKVQNQTEIQEYKFGSDLVVPIRNDGMINATALCKAGNKKSNDYFRLNTTKDYIKAIESNSGIPVLDLVKVEIGGKHSGTWIHRKVGYHLAQWISPEFAVQISNILDELFITGSVIYGKEKSTYEIELLYQNQIKDLQNNHQKLLVKHNSRLKTHRYIKFKESGPCFYIIEQGIPCECKYNVSRKKFGISGVSKDIDNQDTIDLRLRNHRTIWPQLRVNYIIFMKDVDIIEKSIKRLYEKEINPNGHEIIEGVSTETLIQSVHNIINSLGIKEYHIIEDEKIKEYNDYVITTIK